MQEQGCGKTHILPAFRAGISCFNMLKNKKLLLLPLVIVILLAALQLYKTYEYRQLEKQGLNSIKAEVIGEAAPEEKLTSTLFKVMAVTESGLMYEVNDYESDMKKAPLHGASFEMTISYKGHEKKVSVPLKRQPVVEYSIGYPDQDKVKATVYSNGDLEFTGEGQTMDFRETGVPWEKEDYTYVFFSKGVSPSNIDGWFKNSNVQQCLDIPQSIESIISTFEGCEGLKETPEYFQCTELRIMTNAFRGCENIQAADTLPFSVLRADYAFEDCTSLVNAPDLSKTNNLNDISGIFSGCSSLIAVPAIPESVISMPYAFEGCTNIREATPFPSRVADIFKAYHNCTSLQNGASIPESVTDYRYCYAGCIDLNGQIEINTDTEHFDGIFDGAVTSGLQLSIIGNSGRLIEIQQDSENKSIILGNPEEASRQAIRLEIETANKGIS